MRVIFYNRHNRLIYTEKYHGFRCFLSHDHYDELAFTRLMHNKNNFTKFYNEKILEPHSKQY